MTGAEWLNIAVQALVLVSAVWIIKADGKALRDNLETLLSKMTALELSLRDCVKWADLDRELDPMKHEIKEHGEKLASLQVQCAERYRRVS